jgi:hypothetical protein
MSRFLVGLVVVAAGVAGGISLTAVLGGESGSDPCYGEGQLQERRTVPETGKTYNFCRRLGAQIVFDDQGTPVVIGVFDEEVVEYYKTHPAENPVLIAQQTADADLAQNYFVAITPPAANQGDPCPTDTRRTEFPETGVSVCMPSRWTVQESAGTRLKIGDETAFLVISERGPARSAGTKCARPAIVQTTGGELRICATPISPRGGQGHGLILPSGRGGSLSLSDVDNTQARDLAFAVAYSILEE